MSYDLQEQEQLAALKAWWERWGNRVLSLVTAVLLVVAAFYGWQYWQRNQSLAAGRVYEDFLRLEASSEPRARELATALREQYGQTVFAPLAALSTAGRMLAAGDAAGAKPLLQWVVDRSGRPELAAIARVRLAGVLLDEKAYDAALALLDGEVPAASRASFADRRGDILYAQGKPAEARAAWRAAIEAAEPGHPLRRLVEQKLELLPEGA